MFKSKYIFETKRTKAFRYFRNITVICVALISTYLLLGIMFVRFSDDQSKFTDKALFNSPPDLIVIFTGGKGRIQAALEKANEYKQSHVFITGVYSKNTVEKLMEQYPQMSNLDPDTFEIDYEAHNTVENVISTLRYIQHNQNLKKIVVISNDYHILRIKHIIQTIKKEDSTIFFFYGVETDYASLRNLKILYTEVYKFIKTWIFLSMWGIE